MIGSSDCLVYAVYMSAHVLNPATGRYPMNIYVSKIDLCWADVDATGTVDAADTVSFGVAYGTSQPPADVNQDGVINCLDITDFQQALTCGCAGGP